MPKFIAFLVIIKSQIDSNNWNKKYNLDTKMQVSKFSIKYRHCLLDAGIANSARQDSLAADRRSVK